MVWVPLASYRKSIKCNNVAMMQSSQKLYLPIKVVIFLINKMNFFHYSNVPTLKFGFIRWPMGWSSDYSTKTICCPLYVIIREAPQENYRHWKDKSKKNYFSIKNHYGNAKLTVISRTNNGMPQDYAKVTVL